MKYIPGLSVVAMIAALRAVIPSTLPALEGRVQVVLKIGASATEVLDLIVPPVPIETNNDWGFRTIPQWTASVVFGNQGLKRVCENCLTHPKGVIPNPVGEGCRVGVRDLALVVESNQTLANHEVPQGYSSAEGGAGSLTPFDRMTISSSHTPSSAQTLKRSVAELGHGSRGIALGIHGRPERNWRTDGKK